MNDKRKYRKYLYYLFAVLILLILFHFLGFLQLPEGFLIDNASIGQNSTYSFFTRLKFSFINFQEAQNLKVENQLLTDKVNDLLVENNELLSFKSENQELRDILQFKQETTQQIIMAQIIGKDLNRSNTFIVNKGSTDGLFAGLPVVARQGIIVGKLAEVKNNTATVLLLTDNLSQLAISTQDSNKSIGLAQGEFGLSIKAGLIPQDIELAENDIIITSGLEQTIPRGLIIGSISRITSNENDLFKSAIISPAFDYQELTVIGIVIPNQINND